MDHLLKSSNLTFDAAKPWYLTRVIDGVMFRVLLGHIGSRNRLAAVAYGAVALSTVLIAHVPTHYAGITVGCAKHKSNKEETIMAHEHQLTPDMRECIAACLDCHVTCLETSAHCLEMGGEHASAKHQRLLQDCAQICQTSADFMVRTSHYHARTCDVCAEICHACAQECERLGSGDDLMRRCAAVCRRCAESCTRMAHATA